MSDDRCPHGISSASHCSVCYAAELQRWKEKCWQLEADMACRNELRGTIAKLEAELRALREENAALKREVFSLQHSDEYMAGGSAMMPLVKHVEAERDTARRERDEAREVAAAWEWWAHKGIAPHGYADGRPHIRTQQDFLDDLRDRLAKLRAGTEGSGT